jgi:RNA polymerase sigma-70 factor (ECF subfamily)
MEREALTEADVVARAGGGDRRAFGELIRRYQDAVFGLAYSHARSFADAEDIAQEAFLAAWEGLARLRDASSFGPWLHGITLNKVRMHLRAAERRRRSQERHSAFARTQAPGAETHAGEEPARDAVTAALSRLSPARRVAATLYYINGYSCQQVSSFLGVPLGTVKRRLFEARQRLKERLTMVEKKLKAERPKPSFSRRVLERIDSVQVEVTQETAGTVLLTDKKDRSFFVIVARPEADSIKRALQGTKFRRPLTHDLLLNVIRGLGGEVVELVISALKEATFYAILVIRQGRDRHEIDCRPSDGVAIALRAGAPIYLHRSVADRVVMKRKDGTPLSPRSAQRFLKKMEEDFRKHQEEIEKLRAEVIKNPDSVEAVLALASRQDPGQREAVDLYERATRIATSGKDQARAHLGLATRYSHNDELKKAHQHLNRACRLWPGYEELKEFPQAAYLYASRSLAQWHSSGETRFLNEGLCWIELLLKRGVFGESFAFYRLTQDAINALWKQERFQQLMRKHGVKSVGEGLPSEVGLPPGPGVLIRRVRLPRGGTLVGRQVSGLSP